MTQVMSDNGAKLKNLSERGKIQTIDTKLQLILQRFLQVTL